MSVWLIEPRDPLIARDGRPVSVGGSLRTLGFPFPQTLAGAVRTRLAGGAGAFRLTPGEIESLLAIEVAGPLLAELAAEDGDGGAGAWFAPAPRDALLAEAEGTLSLRRLAPHSLRAGEAVDGLGELWPLRADGGPVAGKPPLDPPAFWRWSAFESWLTAPGDRAGLAREELGLPALLPEARAHVAIRPGDRVGLDGMLFTTVGLRFLAGPASGPERFAPRRLALGVRCAGGEVAGRRLALHPGLAPLGGERRLARWYPAGLAWPGLPAAVRERVLATGGARLLLLTPAFFAAGALPGWRGEPWPEEGEVQVTLRAAAVDRPAIVSGWDLAKRQAKPTRRLAPAGSVYFVELRGSREAIGRWCDAVWLRPISDGLQNRRDGFGIAALGSWE